MTNDQERGVDPLALLLFYGAIAALGILAGFLVSTLVLPDSPAGRFGLMAAAAALVVAAVDFSLKRLMAHASRRYAEAEADQERRPLPWYLDALVRVTDHVYPTR